MKEREKNQSRPTQRVESSGATDRPTVVRLPRDGLSIAARVRRASPHHKGRREEERRGEERRGEPSRQTFITPRPRVPMYRPEPFSTYIGSLPRTRGPLAENRSRQGDPLAANIKGH